MGKTWNFHGFMSHMKDRVGKPYRRKQEKQSQLVAWGQKLNIDFTVHGMIRSIQRLGISPEEVIQDVRSHAMFGYSNIGTRKGKFLIKGKFGQYIVSTKGEIITVLTHSQTPVDKFNTKPCKGPYLNTPDVPVFKRSKFISK